MVVLWHGDKVPNVVGSPKFRENETRLAHFSEISLKIRFVIHENQVTFFNIYVTSSDVRSVNSSLEGLVYLLTTLAYFAYTICFTNNTLPHLIFFPPTYALRTFCHRKDIGANKIAYRLISNKLIVF